MTPAPTLPILTGPLGVGRQIHTATTLADGRVLVAGGYDAHDQAVASAVIYDPATDTFSPTGSMAAARGLHTATLLADGRVLIAGGGHPSWVGPQADPYLASAELFDPATGTFSPTGSMAIRREGHTATLLTDGRVLITGGDTVLDYAVDLGRALRPEDRHVQPDRPDGDRSRIPHGHAARRRSRPDHRRFPSRLVVHQGDRLGRDLRPEDGHLQPDRLDDRRARAGTPPRCSPMAASWSPGAAAMGPSSPRPRSSTRRPAPSARPAR